jgi:hypothetical protein
MFFAKGITFLRHKALKPCVFLGSVFHAGSFCSPASPEGETGKQKLLTPSA